MCSEGKDEARCQLDNALQDVNVRYAVLEETEKRAVSRALIEERARYCTFVSMLKPVLVSALCDVLMHAGLGTTFRLTDELQLAFFNISYAVLKYLLILRSFNKNWDFPKSNSLLVF